MCDSFEVCFEWLIAINHQNHDWSRLKVGSSAVVSCSITNLEFVLYESGELTRNPPLKIFHIEDMFQGLLIGVQYEFFRR